jgi:hypothetical protein
MGARKANATIRGKRPRVECSKFEFKTRINAEDAESTESAEKKESLASKT